jgi:(p)ppGpp synthase/HD superfamily hydrolase
MNKLEEAIEIAVEAHRNQKDRYGQPYILHPLRVMMRMNTDEEKITAVLHDVVEDTDIKIEDLKKKGFPENILNAVDCMTKREGEAYEAYMARAKSNPISLKVKIADLEDNMDMRRITKITEKDVERLNKYRKYWEEMVNLR